MYFFFIFYNSDQVKANDGFCFCFLTYGIAARLWVIPFYQLCKLQNLPYVIHLKPWKNSFLVFALNLEGGRKENKKTKKLALFSFYYIYTRRVTHVCYYSLNCLVIEFGPLHGSLMVSLFCCRHRELLFLFSNQQRKEVEEPKKF